MVRSQFLSHRNDVLHAGFRKKPRAAEDIFAKTIEIVAELKSIAVAWRLEE